MADQATSAFTAASTPLGGTEIVGFTQGGADRRSTVNELRNHAGAGDVRRFGVTGSGSDEYTAMQTAMDAASALYVASGAPFTLIIPNGLSVTVGLTAENISGSFNRARALAVPLGVNVQIDGVLKLLGGQSAFTGSGMSGGTGGFLGCAFITTKTWTSSTELRSVITINGTLDLNSNNAANNIVHAIKSYLAEDFRVRGHGRVINAYGNASSGTGENFHVEFYRSHNCSVEGITVDSTDGGLASSGISDDYSSDTFVRGVVVRNMDAQGFTCHGATRHNRIGCTAQSIGANGFNREESGGDDIGCVAGGRVGTNYAGLTPVAYSANQDLGCGTASYHSGFTHQQYYPGAGGPTRVLHSSSTYNKNGSTIQGPGGVLTSWTAGTKTAIMDTSSVTLHNSHVGKTVWFLREADGVFVSDTIATVTPASRTFTTAGTPSGIAVGDSLYIDCMELHIFEDDDFSHNDNYGILDATHGKAGSMYVASKTIIKPDVLTNANGSGRFGGGYMGYDLNPYGIPPVQKGGYYIGPATGHAGSTLTPVSGRLYFIPVYLNEPASVVALSAYLTVAGTVGKYRLGLYAWDPTTGEPTGAALIDTGQQNLPAALGTISAAPATLAAVAPKGLVFAALLFDGMTGTYTTSASLGWAVGQIAGTTQPTSAPNVFRYMTGQATNTALPTVSVTAANAGGLTPNVYLKTG